MEVKLGLEVLIHKRCTDAARRIQVLDLAKVAYFKAIKTSSCMLSEHFSPRNPVVATASLVPLCAILYLQGDVLECSKRIEDALEQNETKSVDQKLMLLLLSKIYEQV